MHGHPYHSIHGRVGAPDLSLSGPLVCCLEVLGLLLVAFLYHLAGLYCACLMKIALLVAISEAGV